MTTINNLKHELGKGLGVRKNNYMIEIPSQNVDAHAINILCQAASLPTRNITTTDVFHKGRKYTLRAETDYVGEYEITVLDDDEMSIRKSFDAWMTSIDDSASTAGSIINDATEVTTAATNLSNAIANGNFGFIYSLFAGGGPGTKYQTDINIWQLNGEGEKVYGYVLQNAFPKALGSIEYSDSTQNELCSYTVTFAFSEFKPISISGSIQSLLSY